MTRHTERPRMLRWLASRRVRAVLCLGVFTAPAAVGTMAFWTVDATIAPGGFTFGTLDLTVGATPGASENLKGEGGTFEYSTLTIANLVPGESIARPFIVRNYGTTGFTFNGSVYTSDNGLVAAGSGLKVAIYLGGAPTDTGTETTGNRSGVCTGGVLLKDQAVSMSTNAVNVSSTPIPLTPGTTQSFCTRIMLDPASPNTLQGKITRVVIKLDAKQVGGP